MGAGGALGIAGVLVARALGARVIAAAASDWKLERVRELLGAEQTVNYARAGLGRGAARRRRRVRQHLPTSALRRRARHAAPVRAARDLRRPRRRDVALDMRMLYRRHLSIIGDTGASASRGPRGLRGGRRAGRSRRRRSSTVTRSSEIAAAHEAALGRELFGRAVITVGGG